MSTRYRMDVANSRLSVQAFAAGFLSFMAHSPLFLVRNFEGELDDDPTVNSGAKLTLAVQAETLQVMNAKQADQHEIEERMRREVLEVNRFPTIRFESELMQVKPIDPSRFILQMEGLLFLHGTARRHQQNAEMRYYSDGMRLMGESTLRLSEFGIRPVTALAGALRLKDSLLVQFDIAAWKEKK